MTTPGRAWTRWTTARRIVVAFAAVLLLFALALVVMILALARIGEAERQVARLDHVKHAGHHAAAMAREQYIHQAHTLLEWNDSHLAHYEQVARAAKAATVHLRGEMRSGEDVRRADEIAALVVESDRRFREVVVPAVLGDTRSRVTELHEMTERPVEQVVALNEQLNRSLEAASDRAQQGAERIRARARIAVWCASRSRSSWPRASVRTSCDRSRAPSRRCARARCGWAPAISAHGPRSPATTSWPSCRGCSIRWGSTSAAIRPRCSRPTGSRRSDRSRRAWPTRSTTRSASSSGTSRSCDVIRRWWIARSCASSRTRCGNARPSSPGCSSSHAHRASHVMPIDLGGGRVARRWRASRRAARRPGSRSSSPAPDPLAVVADESKLRQIVVNLLSNAVEASRDPAAQRGAIRVDWDARRSRLCPVDDRGAGVSADARARLFEPFFTTRARGHGLGLAIARSLARAHGGDIEVAPSARWPGGTRATLWLPLDRRLTS
jgi:hypothetical protein